MNFTSQNFTGILPGQFVIRVLVRDLFAGLGAARLGDAPVGRGLADLVEQHLGLLLQQREERLEGAGLVGERTQEAYQAGLGS